MHGHDFSCIAAIPTSDALGAAATPATTPGAGGSYMYASGAEEKVLRVLEAPTTFLDSLALARGVVRPGGAAARGGASDGGDDVRALGAAVAALGLSNKALFAPAAGSAGGGDGAAADATPGPDMVPLAAAPAAVSRPPLEEHLSQNTLWPEVHKLYGHGNELHCVAASPSGQLLASACKAQSVATAAIWLWEVGSWRPLCQLSTHTLTVTQLAFSCTGSYLLAASRDRSFTVWAPLPPLQPGVDAEGGEACGVAPSGTAAAAARQPDGWRLLARVKAAHARIIWGVAWAPDDRWVGAGRVGLPLQGWRAALTSALWCITPISPISLWPAADNPLPTSISSITGLYSSLMFTP